MAGAIAGAGTWAIGQVALEYYEGGKQVNPNRLRQLYKDFYSRFRREESADELRSYTLADKNAPLTLNEARKEVGTV